MRNYIKGVIFDMDNTILRSKIDFAAMKAETYMFLTSHGILPKDLNLANHTTSTIIKEAIETNLMSDELLKALWDIPKKYEVIGMKGAKLEAGVTELINELQGKYYLVIVTNNSVAAAIAALSENNIYQYFDLVVGREMMNSLKPSSDGFLHVLNYYNHTSAGEWISVGDAWADGKASQDAGIKFISYKGDIQRMNRMCVYPDDIIHDIRELKNFLERTKQTV